MRERGKPHTRQEHQTRDQMIKEIDELQDHIRRLEYFCRKQRPAYPVPSRADESDRHMLEESFDAVIIHAEGKIIYANHAGAKLLGARMARELTGKPVLDIVHPDYRDIVRKRIESSNYDEVKPVIDIKFVSLEGGVIDAEVMSLKIVYHKRPAIKVVFRDITERKQLEERLRQTQFSIDRASDMIFWVAPDGHFTYVNNAACRVLGYSREELLTMSVFDMSTRHNPLNWEEHRQELKERESVTFENTFIAKDGRMIPVELSVNYLAFGGREYNCASVRDITERKRAEEELKSAKAQSELYLDLMGHDINNMHQIALGYLEMAKDMCADERQAGFLDKPIEVLQRSSRLITNVRKLQKLHDGKSRMDKVDVRRTLTSVQREFGSVPDKRVSLNIRVGTRCRVMANELLYDIFANLVSNAIKHTGDRAVICIEMDQITEHGNNYCRVSVEDNGPGISDDFKGVIFSRVLKGTPGARGIGIGLYLVKSLVDSYGGQVWVEDRVPGDHTKGAKFVVVLPAVNE